MKSQSDLLISEAGLQGESPIYFLGLTQRTQILRQRLISWLALSVPDERYYRTALCALNLISTFLLLYTRNKTNPHQELNYSDNSRYHSSETCCSEGVNIYALTHITTVVKFKFSNAIKETCFTVYVGDMSAIS